MDRDIPGIAVHVKQNTTRCEKLLYFFYFSKWKKLYTKLLIEILVYVSFSKVKMFCTKGQFAWVFFYSFNRKPIRDLT